MKSGSIFGVCALFALTCVAAPQDGRRLVWGDEFDGKSLDQSKWKFHATTRRGEQEE